MSRLRQFTTIAFAAVAATAVALSAGTPAAAHDPIFLTDDQTTPDTGPYLPDGAISWAIYGTFPVAEQTRGFEFDLRDGDDLYISLLIPNLEPEISLPDPELPYVELTLPDGGVRTLEANMREIFDEQFSRTSYVTLVEVKEPALAGRHTVLVHSRGPSRFVVAVGEREEFFTPAERTVDRPTDFLGIADPLNAWYQTPPGDSAPSSGDGDEGTVDDVEIDVEAMEEELDELAAEAEAEEAATDQTLPTGSVGLEATSGVADDVQEVVADESAGADPAVEEQPEATPTVIGDVDDGDSGLGWVMPLVIVGAALGGGAWWWMRRRAGAAG